MIKVSLFYQVNFWKCSKNAKNNENLNVDLANIFKALKEVGHEAEDDIEGLFGWYWYNK